MANISREDDLKDLEERMKNNGNRPYGRTFPSTHRAKAYNAVHGTQIADDDILDLVLQNERSLRRLLR